jgi:hypothetical protein
MAAFRHPTRCADIALARQFRALDRVSFGSLADGLVLSLSAPHPPEVIALFVALCRAAPVRASAPELYALQRIADELAADRALADIGAALAERESADALLRQFQEQGCGPPALERLIAPRIGAAAPETIARLPPAVRARLRAPPARARPLPAVAAPTGWRTTADVCGCADRWLKRPVVRDPTAVPGDPAPRAGGAELPNG